MRQESRLGLAGHSERCALHSRASGGHRGWNREKWVLHYALRFVWCGSAKYGLGWKRFFSAILSCFMFFKILLKLSFLRMESAS